MGEKRRKTIQLGHHRRQMAMFEGCVLGNLRGARCCLKLLEQPSSCGKAVSDGCSRGLCDGGVWVHQGCWMSESTSVGCSLMHAWIDWHAPWVFVLHVVTCVTLQPGLSVPVARCHGLRCSSGCINWISEWIAIWMYFLTTKGTDKLLSFSAKWGKKPETITEENRYFP